ncbi:MAG: ABC transporter permease, partial [Pseudomonadota bacterium]|nr:ABC transporter permease [Pseudomonadota bacterium]
SGGRGQLARQLMAMLAIALGTALGMAVNLINDAAVDEFAAAANQFGGRADLTVSAGRDGFDENLYARVAALPGVALASPVVDGELPVHCGAPAGRDGAPTLAMRILGLDIFRAGRLSPADMPELATALKLLTPGQALLSRDAADRLACRTGDRLSLVRGGDVVDYNVAGVMAAQGSARSFVLLDIGYAQELLAQTGRLQRLDLRLRPGSAPGNVASALARMLPAGVHAGPPADSGTRSAALSRAYRANLTVLALIALFTGAFLVFTTQTLAVARRRSRIALLRAIGVERRQILLGIALEGLKVGVAGAAAGVAAGTMVAAWALHRYGGDLGAGYFAGTRAIFHPDLGLSALFLLLGTACAVAGSLLPAWQAAHADPALALRQDSRPQRRGSWRALGGAAAIGCGALLCLAPAIQGLPLAGYAAIAMLLLGLLALLPEITARLLACLPMPDGALPGLALTGLRVRSRDAALSLATVVVAVSLVAAMLVMIGSFRHSLQAWLDQVLPADIYLRGSGAVPGLLPPATRAQLAALEGVAAVDTLRTRTVLLRPDLPPVALLARDLDLIWSHRGLAVIDGIAPGAAARPRCDLPCAWASEALVDLYGVQRGDKLRVPLEGRWIELRIAGIWRDYARQFGALVIDRTDYQALTADALADDAALYLRPGYAPAQVLAAIPDAIGGAGRFEIAEPRTIKAMSLRIFDRSFTVTYALEAVALVIGLLGISAGFGAQVLARQREFGVLVHLGATRRQVLSLIAWEGLLISTIGVGLGLAAGGVIGVILIRVVNRQSFHWSMETHVPWTSLALLALLMVAAATLTALFSGRDGSGRAALAAVNEDA